MGRPIEIMDEDVVRAGGVIQAENRAVNATRLWRTLGKRGRPERLLEVWTRHADASATAYHEPFSPAAPLPEAASRLLSDCKAQLGAGLDGCVREIYAAVERTLVGRFQAEMAAMTTSRETNQAELHEAWQALGELAEEHDAALLRVQDRERDVLTAHATLHAERGTLSRAEQDKIALSARIDGLTADLTAAFGLVRAAEVGRTRAETLTEAVRTELHATQAALDIVRAANLDLEREACASRRTCQLHAAQLDRQAGEFRDLQADVADARERYLEQATQAAGAERALEALERVIAGSNAGYGTVRSNSKRKRLRLTAEAKADMPGSEAGGTHSLIGPGYGGDDLTPRIAV